MKRMDLTIEMNDGRIFHTQTTVKDYINYDRTARKQKPPWGSVSENVALWEIFIGWSSARRTGQYEGTWEEFLEECAVVDGKPLETDPTPDLVGNGSS